MPDETKQDKKVEVILVYTITKVDAEKGAKFAAKFINHGMNEDKIREISDGILKNLLKECTLPEAVGVISILSAHCASMIEEPCIMEAIATIARHVKIIKPPKKEKEVVH